MNEMGLKRKILAKSSFISVNKRSQKKELNKEKAYAMPPGAQATSKSYKMVTISKK